MDATDNRAKRLWWLLIPYSLAAFALATFTIGRAVGDNTGPIVGLGVVGLTVLFIALLPWVRVREDLTGRVALGLIAGGVVCAVAAVALQWHVISLAAEQSRRAAELVAASGGSGRSQVSVEVPGSPAAFGYLCLLFAIGLVALGLRVASPRLTGGSGRTADDAEHGAAADGGA
jgi:hypothetical protein